MDLVSECYEIEQRFCQTARNTPEFDLWAKNWADAIETICLLRSLGIIP